MNIRDYIAAPSRHRSVARPAQDADFRALTAATGYEPGPVLRAILGTENGGQARLGVLELPDRTQAVMTEFLSTQEIVDSWRVVSLREFGDPSHRIPIMRDAFGNFLVLTTAESVLFFNHDTGELLDLSLSLEDYPACLKAMPPEAVHDAEEDLPLGVVERLQRYRVLGDSVVRAERDAAALKELLSVAVLREDAKLVRAVLARGRELDIGATLGAVAELGAVAGYVEDPVPLMEAFLAEGVDVNAPGVRGNTALMKAAIGSSPDVVKWLLDHGADPLRTNDRGFTAKREAIAAKRPENAALLP
jgi:hypothetical protein